MLLDNEGFVAQDIFCLRKNALAFNPQPTERSYVKWALLQPFFLHKVGLKIKQNKKKDKKKYH